MVAINAAIIIIIMMAMMVSKVTMVIFIIYKKCFIYACQLKKKASPIQFPFGTQNYLKMIKGVIKVPASAPE